MKMTTVAGVRCDLIQPQRGDVLRLQRVETDSVKIIDREQSLEEVGQVLTWLEIPAPESGIDSGEGNFPIS
jgi:hypothetical protein